MKKRQLRTITHCFGLGMLVCVLSLFAGCSKEENPDRLPDGQYPINFTTTVEGLTAEQSASRATVDNAWTGGEKVALRIDGQVKQYTATATGVLSAADGVTPWYWASTTETKTASAWFPYSDAQPTSFSVETDQSDTGFQASDLIYAASQPVTLSNSFLTFCHLPVKVVINLKNGEGVTQEELANASVSIENQTTTSGAIADDWSVEQVAPSAGSIIPNLRPATPDFPKSVQAIVVPQQMQGKRFICVMINGISYCYTPTSATDADLQAGRQYTYVITVGKAGITVAASDVTAWTGTENDVTSKKVTIFSASDLKMGDYYYSDGTWSDGGLRKLYTDGTFLQEDVEPVLTDVSGNARTILGIIFKVGKDDSGDWIDDCSYMLKGTTDPMTTINGYVLALYDATNGNPCVWGLKRISAGTNTEQHTGFYGYKNTNSIKAFALSTGKNLQNDFPATYHATVSYEISYPAPTNSSGWFLLSAGQSKYWLNNRDALLASVRKATGQSDYIWKSYYWSSSEDGATPERNDAWILNFYNGFVSRFNKDHIDDVRSMFAF